MMALKKRRTAAAVDAERFAQRFAELFGRQPTEEEFKEWCAAWGGVVVEKDKCVFVHIEAL
jgi:hypothetical protein